MLTAIQCAWSIFARNKCSHHEKRIEVLIFYPNHGSHIVVIMPAVSTRAPPGHTAKHCNPVIGNVKNMQCVITFYISGKSLL